MRLLAKFIFLASLLLCFSLKAQCKSFVKKKCLPSLAPFITNGQINTAVLSPGDSTAVPLNFFENTEYRIIVCNQEVLGKISFKVFDANNKLVFHNKTLNYVTQWDFKSLSNQTLSLVVEVPEETENHSQIMQSGCVSIIIGFKKK